MRDDLHLYYEKELDFLRQMGVAFKEQYPLEAKRLALEPNKCEDPHVERLIECFAFLAARVHMRLDDDFPEITEALLQVLYPHYLQPIPSMSIVQMEVDPDEVKPDAGLTIERNAVLDSPPVDGVRCKFRTCYDVTFWPVEVADARWLGADASAFGLHASMATAAVVLTLQCLGDLTFSKLANPLPTVPSERSGRFCARSVRSVVQQLCGHPGEGPEESIGAAGGAQARGFAARGLYGAGSDASELRRSFGGNRVPQEHFRFREFRSGIRSGSRNPAGGRSATRWRSRFCFRRSRGRRGANPATRRYEIDFPPGLHTNRQSVRVSRRAGAGGSRQI